MKPIARFLTHPVFISLVFCCLIISGKHSAVFYGFVLQLGIMHGVLHAILGILGIILLITSVTVNNNRLKSSLDVAGAFCLIISLIRFFLQPKGDYNYNTFRESVPLIILILFACVLITNIIYHLRRLAKP